jgi:hypothetical protein
MTDEPSESAPEPSDSVSDAEHFARITSGVYRRADAVSVWKALQFAVRNELAAENPTIMMIFVRIAEVYPQIREYLSGCVPAANEDQQKALSLILDPPEGVREAEYLPDEIQSPGEMDLCWGEFLVTGSLDPIEKVMVVLDREDLTRGIIDELLTPPESPQLVLDDAEREELATIGIALGLADKRWRIASPGDIDILLWFGLKDQNVTCARIAAAMSQDQLVHLANKGAALWSLRANAEQHGKIRLYCEQQARKDGGIGRQLIVPEL